jgi:hypothetical protein
MKIPPEVRAYVRVTLRDTLHAYDLVDLLDLMAEVCQDGADGSGPEAFGLPRAAWQRRADVLREAAERLDRPERGAGQPPDGSPS